MKRLPTFEDCCSMERLSGGDWCPEKSLVCWSSSKTNGIMVKNYSTGELHRITSFGHGESYPRFSPDGSKLLFTSVMPGMGPQIMVASSANFSVVKQVTKIDGGVMEPVWSPDGSRILFASNQSSGGMVRKGRPDEAVVIEDFHYKMEGAGFVQPDGHVQLYIANLDTGAVEKLTDGPYDRMHHNFSPDGKKIVYASNENRSREDSIGFDLFIMDLTKEKPEARQLSQDFEIVSYPNPVRPVFTPDSSQVIMAVLNPDADPAMGYPEGIFYKFPLDNSAPSAVFTQDSTLEQCVQFPYNAFSGRNLDKMQIDPDTGNLYFTSAHNGQSNIYRLKPDCTHAELVSGGKQVYNGLGKICGGKMLVSRCEVTVPEAYYIMDAATGALEQKLVQSAEDILENVELSPTSDFFFRTLDGESRVHGFVMEPARLDEGKNYPALLYVHGGPHPFYTYGLTMEFQAFAANGMAVIFCNPRGSSSYGAVHQNYARSEDGSAYTDCLQFVDECCRRYPWIDPDSVAVTGGSYGGYMTNYMATHSKRFKAYITQRSVASNLIMYASSDMQGSSRQFRNFEEFMVDQLKSSPVSYAEKIDRPFLILQGEDDFRTPKEGAHQLFIAVKDTHPDLPVRLVIYPHVSHDQPSNYGQLMNYYGEMLSWLKKYLLEEKDEEEKEE